MAWPEVPLTFFLRKPWRHGVSDSGVAPNTTGAGAVRCSVLWRWQCSGGAAAEQQRRQRQRRRRQRQRQLPEWWRRHACTALQWLRLPPDCMRSESPGNRLGSNGQTEPRPENRWFASRWDTPPTIALRHRRWKRYTHTHQFEACPIQSSKEGPILQAEAAPAARPRLTSGAAPLGGGPGGKLRTTHLPEEEARSSSANGSCLLRTSPAPRLCCRCCLKSCRALIVSLLRRT